ncbi:hypothetical protein [Kineococcus glutinatus]|uniref:Uncharacterized protein n=1 Tax=Kineococcus glutinatus TaxID=1070872 RepID=A0ABP9H541_9ACTN
MEIVLLLFLLLLGPAAWRWGADSRRAGGWCDAGVWDSSYREQPAARRA